MAILTTANVNGKPASWPLESSGLIIGRSSDNAVAIDERFVSRRHAVIERKANGFSITDLGSKNGTWVNGQRLTSTPRRLRDGDMIQIGSQNVSLRFVEGDTTVTFSAGVPDSGLRVDNEAREVFVDGQMIVPRLSRKEFDLLSFFWERRSLACSRDDLAARGWPERPDHDVSDTEIEQYIRRLRRHIGDTGKNATKLVTVRGFGYKLL